jgi:phosphate transport system permease protein
MEISSMGKRKMFDRGFLVICVITSLVSIAILAVLLASIFINAMPTFGSHVDTFESDHRWLVVQGQNEGNDPESVDQGDIIQGLFIVENFKRGGLGNSNDTEYLDRKGKAVGPQKLIGICSMEVESKDSEGYVNLVPAKGSNNVVEIAKQLDAVPDEDWTSDLQAVASSATMVMFENESAEFDLATIKTSETLYADGKLAGTIEKDQGWSAVLVAGHESESFSVLKLALPTDNTGKLSEMARIGKVRVRKRAGEFQGLYSVLAHNLGPEVSFKPVKLRRFGEDDLCRGDLKFTDSKLAGLSRRKKNGFTLADNFNMVYCPVPESTTNTAGHIKHFLTETNKSVPSEVGIGPALTGTLWVCLGCALFALPLGIGTAVFLEEFKPTNRILRFFHSVIQLNITNLAGVPSIVYGILGLTAFAGMFGLFGIAKDPFVEVGANHYFQYLSESNKSILVPITDKSRRDGRRVDLVRKSQKHIFRTSVQGIKIPLQIDDAAVAKHQHFRSELVSVEGSLHNDDAIAAHQKAIEKMDALIEQLGKAFDEDTLLDAAKQSELALRELVNQIKRPTLVDGMEVFSADNEPLKLNVVQPGEDLPTDKTELAVTLRSTAVGGPMSKKAWYYFQLPFGRSVLAASLTLMLVILPVIIIASQEALRAVPPSLRECALGLGSTPWQVVRNVTLPAAIPSIMTGAILAMSRAIGEAAPILVICGILFVTSGPTHLMDIFSILPIQIYDMTQLPKDQELMINAHNVAAAGIVVLLAILLTFNAVAITIRQWTQKPLS